MDDLNTAQIFSELHALSKTGQMSLLNRSLRFLGLFNDCAFGPRRDQMRDDDITPENREKIDGWINARLVARAAKDWKESDRIRDELAAMGITLKDGKDKDGKPVTTWEIAR